MTDYLDKIIPFFFPLEFYTFPSSRFWNFAWFLQWKAQRITDGLPQSCVSQQALVSAQSPTVLLRLHVWALNLSAVFEVDILFHLFYMWETAM